VKTNSFFLSLVIPTYNEAGNIAALLAGVHGALGAYPHEIIVVDDDSADQTWKIAEDISKNAPWLRVHRRVGERGLSSAVIKGFQLAAGSAIGVMDADQSHDETILPAMLGKLEDGADLVIGSRRIPGGGASYWPWYRRWMSNGATFLAQVFLDLKISDPMSGYFVMRRSLYEACKDKLRPTGYKILLEIYCKGAPQRADEVPFVFKNRKEGHSKLTARVAWQYLRMVLQLRRPG
jgi:dolichol-phosphate mannosyltransferase